MKIKQMLKLTFKSWGVLIYICVVFGVIVFWMAHTDFRQNQMALKDVLEEYGSVEQALSEDEQALSFIDADSKRSYIMLGAGLFGGSVGMLLEMFGIAMQFSVSRRTLRWAYIFQCIFYGAFTSVGMYLEQIAIKAWFVSRCKGDYEIFKPAYEGIDISLALLGRFFLLSLVVLFAGSTMWLIVTRFRKSIGFFIATIVCIFAIVLGIVMAVVADVTWVIYLIGAGAAAVFLILMFMLISTETVEHQIGT